MLTSPEHGAAGGLLPPRKPRVSVLRVLVLLIPALVLFCTILILWILRPHVHPASPQAACIALLKQIEGAKATWALEGRKLPTDVPVAGDLFGEGRYIVKTPRCPAGGDYTLGAVREKPRCSIPGHTLSVSE